MFFQPILDVIFDAKLWSLYITGLTFLVSVI